MNYIRAIDNLRGIAVLAVLLNHLSEAYLPSGFFGVDIFFVISGFVVTKSIADRNKENFLLTFYTARMKRLLPALMTCVLVSSIFTLLFVNTEFASISLRTGHKSLTAMSNLFLISSSNDYFSLSSSLNVFTHTWSLSVEEQFYLIFPFIFYLIRFMFGANKNKFFLVLALLSSCSFAWYLFSTDEVARYYSIFSRFWQIAIGGLGYHLVSARPVISSPRYIDTLLALITICLFVPQEYQFIVRVIISVLTMIILILIGSSKKPQNFVLENANLNLIGKASYSLYLWHWPVLAIFRHTVGLSVSMTLIALLIISALTYVSYNFIENKFRYLNYSRFSLKTQVLSGLILVVSMSFLVKSARNFDWFVGKPSTTFSETKAWNLKYCSISKRTESNKFLEIDFKKCRVGKIKNDSPQVFIFGDSFAQQVIPAFIPLANQEGFKIYATTGPGCHTLPFTSSSEKIKLICYKHYSRFLEFALNNIRKGDSFVVSFYYGPYLSENIFSENEKGISASQAWTLYTQSLSSLNSKLKERGAKLVVIGNVPELNIEPNLCYQPWSKFRDDCQKSRIDNKTTIPLKKHDNRIRDLARSQQFSFIDLMPIFENAAMEDGVYYNRGHISTKGALMAESILRASLH